VIEEMHAKMDLNDGHETINVDSVCTGIFLFIRTHSGRSTGTDLTTDEALKLVRFLLQGVEIQRKWELEFQRRRENRLRSS